MPTSSLNPNLDLSSLYAQGNALGGLGGDPAQAMAQLGPQYQQSYLGALGLNQQLLGGVQTGYDKLRQNVDSQYSDIHQGYQSLYGDVLGRIAGTNASNLADINASYSANAGHASQDLISRGLGNSTVQSSVQRGIELDRQRALTGSNNQFAQLQAGYASQLGQAGLQSQQQGVGMGANLGQAQLGELERVNVPYPNAQMYTNLAQMYGSSLQRQQDQQRADQLQPQASMFYRGGGAATSGGSSSGFGAMRPSAFDYGSSGGTGFSGGGGFGGFGGYFGGGGYSGGGAAPMSQDRANNLFNQFSDTPITSNSALGGFGGYAAAAGMGQSAGGQSDVGQFGFEGDPGSQGPGYYGDYGEYFGG